ncbi:MAG: hypothetical protein CMJ78_22080 [Planctomycetaceae bacterium]|nr:hypothetical protein [Planctomycetaceae bacterium]
MNANHQTVQTANRRGAVVIILLIVLVLVAALGASMVNLALTQRKQSRREAFRSQSLWLCEFGIERAAAAISANAEYTGEEWAVSEDELESSYPGTVRIEVKPDESKPNRRVVNVTAQYPNEMAIRVQVSKTVVIDR